MPKFNEDNTTEQMLLATLQRNGWEYIPATSLNSGVSCWIILPQLPPEDAEHLWLEGDVFGHTFRVEFPIVRGGDLP